MAETRDDAMGEVFDKVGKRVGLPFPAGAEVDSLAEQGDAAAHPMPIASCGESLDFSFSGLKSRALLDLDRLVRDGVAIDAEDGGGEPMPRAVLDLLAGFRAAAVGQILDRVARLYAARPFTTLAVSGGAAANRLLRRELASWAAGTRIDLRLVELVYSGDNAAMIANAALVRHRRGERDDPRLVDAASRIALEA
jgi:N6-L-threonylcarbamoyladenine synthase